MGNLSLIMINPYHSTGIRKNAMGISHRSCVIDALFADEAKSEQPAQDQAARPTGVQNVEIVSFLLGIERGDERIDGRFAHAVAEREHEHADVQAPVRGVLAVHFEHGRRGQLHDGRQDVQQKRADEDHLVADAIGEQAEEDDREGHAGEAAAGDRAQFGFGETEYAFPTRPARRRERRNPSPPRSGS